MRGCAFWQTKSVETHGQAPLGQSESSLNFAHVGWAFVFGTKDHRFDSCN